MADWSFFNRDISWLSFNERVLQEAANNTVPLLERFKFLSIYSSNLDEFYRVRMPAIMAIEKIYKDKNAGDTYLQATEIINGQLEQFGRILNDQLLPLLEKSGYVFLNNGKLLAELLPETTSIFFEQIAGLLQPVLLKSGLDFFPENNQLYLSAIVEMEGEEQVYLVNIPCQSLPRFFKIAIGEITFILYLEDIISANLPHLLEGKIKGAYNIKITRDAALELDDEYEEDMAEKIEKQLRKREMGFATRFLYQPDTPLRYLQNIIQTFNLQKAAVVEGGRHHNLRDFASLPIAGNDFSYPPWPPLERINYDEPATTLFDKIVEADRIIHAPYTSYNTVVRFFNEAAIDNTVEEIYTTLYRVANNSRIVQALISAAKNGKHVYVLVELKARFDEANNIHWAKEMKAAGVRIIYSDNKLKVHAKVALVKRKHATMPYIGLLATGNLNESTARFYTDHILLTAHQPILGELDILFNYLRKGKKPASEDALHFHHLLIAQFNLQTAFLALINRETENARKGMPAAIIIKLNNLEEEVLIRKLYEASNAGVKIQLIVRSICRLVPGIPGQSENITVKRIVDRYLEHGRVFIFHNNSKQDIWMGSADWMNRNIYRRIEVCFPVYSPSIKQELLKIITMQLDDNVSAVSIDSELRNVSLPVNAHAVRSQLAIYEFLKA